MMQTAPDSSPASNLWGMLGQISAKVLTKTTEAKTPVPALELPTAHPAQQKVLDSKADIIIFGGAAGGGKSFALLLTAAQNLSTPDYTAQIFRRELTQVRQQGGMWEKAMGLFAFQSTPNLSSLRFQFPAKSSLGFGHLESEASKYIYQGAEFAFIGWDELTHFTKTQFFYMLSRLRTTCGVKTRTVANTNPDPESWVLELIAWWIGEDGFPISERSGVVRYMVRNGDVIEWFDAAEAATARCGELGRKNPEKYIKSLTFIGSKLEDNPSLDTDGEYRATLSLLPNVEQQQLLGGNWKVKNSAGLILPRGKARIIETAPDDILRKVRAWDFGGTSDYTACIKWGKTATRWVLLDYRRFKGAALDNDQTMLEVAREDGAEISIVIPQDPGEAGKTLAKNRIASLGGYHIVAERPTGSKVTRASLLASQWQGGNIDIVRLPQLEALLSECDGFPDGANDDFVDALATGFNFFENNPPPVKRRPSKLVLPSSEDAIRENPFRT